MRDSRTRHDRPLPLAGVRVLDISQVMAGPYACMLLGDLGADVIKIEPPGTGDQTRGSMGFKMKGPDSMGFLNMNRNKRSVTLNLKSEAGREVLLRMAKDADILDRELPARRDEAAGPGLRRPEGRQPAAGLHQHLRLRPDRALGRPPGLRPDGAGDVGRDERDGLSRRPPGEGRRAGRRHRLRAVRHLCHAGRLHRREDTRGRASMSMRRCSIRRWRFRCGTSANTGARASRRSRWAPPTR